MKKKSLIIVIVVILIIIALVAAIVVPLLSKGKTADNAEGNSETVSTEVTTSLVQETTAPKTEEDTSDQIVETEQESESSEENDSTAGSSSGGSGGSWGSNEQSSENSGDNESQPESQSQSSGESIADIPVISFPYAISGTDLVVQQVSSYDGYFVEDGSDKEVSGIAAIVLTNNGDDLEFVGIGISQGSRSLAFSASQIPAGATVIIQEQNGASYSNDPYYSATATTQTTDSFEMSEKLVSVSDNGNNALTVTNISKKDISSVKIFFKNYLEEDDVYVGGITYTITLTDLEAGASLDVSASHYDSKYSKVMEVISEQ